MVLVVLWVYGGGYVGGDKFGMKEFVICLVVDFLVVFILMNYELVLDVFYLS